MSNKYPTLFSPIKIGTMENYNHRTDQYGGSFENRMRLPVEIVQAIKAKCGVDFQY